MVNELRSLLQESSSNAPYDHFDATSLLRPGRSRVRRRRAAVVGVAGLAAAAVVAVSTFALNLDPKADPALPTGPVTEPVGPVLTLSDATASDLTSAFESTSDGLDLTNTRLVDGVTDDGQAIVRSALGAPKFPSVTLVDLATGTEDPLPELPGRVSHVIEGNSEHIVYAAETMARRGDSRTRTYTLDRASETWQEMTWPGLPGGTVTGAAIGPDDRLYVALAVGAALDNATGEGITGDLWSLSLTDPADIRDEGLAVGSFAIDGDHLVWNERSNGFSDKLTVHDLQTGEEASFDPRSGRSCTQGPLGLDDERLVMSQFCGTQDGLSDDRVQIVTLTGEPVVTIQGESVTGYADGAGHAIVSAVGTDNPGVYSYDLVSGDFVRLSTSTASVAAALRGPVADGWLMWTEGQGPGWVQKVAQLP